MPQRGRVYRMWVCREDIGPRQATDRIRTPHWWQPGPSWIPSERRTLSTASTGGQATGMGAVCKRQKERPGLGNSRPDYFGGKIHDGAWGEPQRRPWL